MTSTTEDRPYMLTGPSYKMKVSTPTAEFSVYMNLNYDEKGNPFEVFINCKKVEFAENMTALTILISRALRSGVPLDVVADDLMSIHSPVTSHFHEGEMVKSLHARIGQVLMSAKNNPTEVVG